MARPRIFVSHSSSECEEDGCHCAAYRDAVCGLLKDHGCDPVVDREVLRGGDEWHRKLLTELLGSHGTVLLLSPHTLDSHYVMEEALLAGALWEADPRRYLLLPVMLPGFRREDLRGSKLDRLDLGRFDMADWSTTAGPTGPAAPPAEVAQSVRPLVERFGSLPYPMVNELVADRIDGVATWVLEEVAKELGVALIAYARDHTNYVVSAGLLSERPVKDLGAVCAMRKALKRLLPLLKDKDHRREIVDVVVPFSRVPGRAAEQLRALRGTSASGRIALLDARRVRTAEMYVRRASETPVPWQTHIAVPSHGTDFVGSVVEDVGGYLAEGLCFGSHDKDVLRRVLAREEEESGPVTILLDMRPDAELVRRLLAEYPKLLFLFAHEQVGTDACAAGHSLLEPLSPGQEMDMLGTHQQFSQQHPSG